MNPKIYLLALLASSLAACGGGDNETTTNVLPASPNVTVSPLSPQLDAASAAKAQDPVATPPVTPTTPSVCAHLDPQPAHGKDPACHG